MIRHPVHAAALAAFLVLTAAPAGADDDDDHARARAALEAGKILPLETIADAARRHSGGTVLDVELEEEDDGPRRRRHDRNRSRDPGEPADRPPFVYEVKLLAPDGCIVKLDYDAETGALLRERRRR